MFIDVKSNTELLTGFTCENLRRNAFIRSLIGFFVFNIFDDVTRVVIGCVLE